MWKGWEQTFLILHDVKLLLAQTLQIHLCFTLGKKTNKTVNMCIRYMNRIIGVNNENEWLNFRCHPIVTIH